LKLKDYIDGIWNVGSKKLDRHASWTASLETDLVSWYKLDETSGTTASDSHGGNDGMILSQVGLGEDGIINKSMNFTASGSQVNTTSDMGLDGASSWTFNAWVYSTGTEENILTVRESPHYVSWIKARQGAKIRMMVSTSSTEYCLHLKKDS